MKSLLSAIIQWWGARSLRLRALLGIAAAALAGYVLLLAEGAEDSGIRSSNLIVFIFINFVILLLLVLIFLVGRQFIKLLFEHRRRMLGARLRLKLVAAFVGLTLVPLFLVFLLANGLLNRAIEGWFSGPVEGAVTGALDVGREHYALLSQVTMERGERLASVLNERWFAKSDAAKQRGLEGFREEHRLFSVKIVDREGKVLVDASHPTSGIDEFNEPAPDRNGLAQALKGEPTVLSEERRGNQFVRAYLPLNSADTAAAVLLVTSRTSEELRSALDEVNVAYREYEQLKLFRNQLKSSYLLTLSVIMGVILFSAIWVGLYIAREIAVPIQRLAQGTTLVARGNYDFQLRIQGDDEIAFLVRSFNQMTTDLKRASEQAEERRLLIEAVLSNLAVGVIAIDGAKVVTLINAAAQRLVGAAAGDHLRGRPISEILPPPLQAQLAALFAAGGAEGAVGHETRRVEMGFSSEGRERRIICTAGEIVDERGTMRGSVLIFDDITELAKAQQMAAWREVARRIAHEIKNPLTPIQLSAQRLERLVQQGGAAELPVQECVQTIVENVDSIKRLANEFSNFARMPAAELSEGDLNQLVSETLAPFAESHSRIQFQFIADPRLPRIAIDREQMRRMLMNLIANAITATESYLATHHEESSGKVTVRSGYDDNRRLLWLEVADSGPGIPESEKSRIYDPYYTTKPGGTGLGLPIVVAVLAEHDGTIRLFDNTPHGCRFLVELPQQRRIKRTADI